MANGPNHRPRQRSCTADGSVAHPTRAAPHARAAALETAASGGAGGSAEGGEEVVKDER